MYTVDELLYDLDGHDGNHEVKIKLNDGTVKDIAGINFINIIVGGDDVLYITEADLIRDKYLKEVEAFYCTMKELISNLDELNAKCINANPDFDNDFILDMKYTIATTCDSYFKALNLDIKYEEGCGSDEELHDKLNILNNWIKRKKL